MAEGGVEIVAPQQADHPPAEPDAFRIAGRPARAPAALRRIRRSSAASLAGSWPAGGFVGRLGVVALGEAQGRMAQRATAEPDSAARQAHARNAEHTMEHGSLDLLGRVRADEDVPLPSDSVSIAARCVAGSDAARRAMTTAPTAAVLSSAALRRGSARGAWHDARCTVNAEAVFRSCRTDTRSVRRSRSFALTALAIVARVVVARRAGRDCRRRRWRQARSSTASPMRRSAARRIRSVEAPDSTPAQIDEDLALLSQITDCVRTYSVEHGLDQVAEIAQRYGMKVMHGHVAVATMPDKNRKQIETGDRARQALSRRHPAPSSSATRCCCAAKCRRPTSPPSSARSRRRCRCRSPMRTSGSSGCAIRDVAERGRFRHHPHPAVLGGLPDPGARRAAAHVDAIRKQVAAAFPGKEILIGEVGWPSAGRMREGALPSPSNQARVIQRRWRWRKRENFRVNVIEAFDQPWKRAARRHGRRPLGHLRPRHRRAEIQSAAAPSPTIRTGACRRWPASCWRR